MPTLLVINASPRCGASVSRKHTSLFVNEWRATERDLVATKLPFVDLPWIGGAFTPPEQYSPASAAAIKTSDDLVAELQSADHIVLGAVLKAYIDHVVPVGKTVIDNVGQLTGKQATVIFASGGNFSPSSPIEGSNLASGYRRQVLGFIGISNLDIIPADRARAGMAGETATDQFGDKLRLAAAA